MNPLSMFGLRASAAGSGWEQSLRPPLRAKPRRRLGCVGLCLVAWGVVAPSVTAQSVGPAAHPPTVASEDILVAAAASLGPALQRLVQAFERDKPAVRVGLHLAASGTLVAQLNQGLAADILATADVATMERAQGLGLVQPQTVRVFAGNRLLVVGRQAPPRPGLQALRDTRVRFIALGEPQAVPLGRYARQALQAQGLWPALAPKAVYADSARQVLGYAMRGEADAAVVYASDAQAAGPGLQVWAELPSPEPVRYAVATLQRGRAAVRPGAHSFVAFLESPQGRALLQAQGLTVPPFSVSEP